MSESGTGESMQPMSWPRKILAGSIIIGASLGFIGIAEISYNPEKHTLAELVSRLNKASGKDILKLRHLGDKDGLPVLIVETPDCAVATAVLEDNKGHVVVGVDLGNPYPIANDNKGTITPIHNGETAMEIARWLCQPPPTAA